MKTVTIHDAKTNLSKYIKEAKAGRPVYIGGFGKAEVALVAVDKHTGNRDFSLLKDKVSAASDAFSPETDQEVAKLILGDQSA